MKKKPFQALSLFAILMFAVFGALAQNPYAVLGTGPNNPYARDANQSVDTAYTAKIKEYTTAPQFNTSLTDYLPASTSVPTPKAVLGDIAGAPNLLPYSADVHRYFRLLAQATPRVRVFSIGKSEEGREMIAVAVADESLMKDLDANTARLAQLADPRTLDMDDAKADALIKQSAPVYYMTGAIHSPETGSPTALMELAYRLAVDEAPYIKHIRSHVITLITPIVETDGRDRMVDVYNWHRANPDKQYPNLVYWGRYVAHDNNRDNMAMTLALSRNVTNAYLKWHPQVMHDLHESGSLQFQSPRAGPMNPVYDPILTSEWDQLGSNNVEQSSKLGLPGVWDHGAFDNWSPGYMMSLAVLRNSVTRLYETFGNGGADTQERILSPDEYSRTWFRPNPPPPKFLWSHRNNNNYQQTSLLTALHYVSLNGQHLLGNFWLKSKRSVMKPQLAGPAAYVLTADEKHKGAQQYLLYTLQNIQHLEVQQATAAFTVDVAADAQHAHEEKKEPSVDKKKDKDEAPAVPPKLATVKRTFPAGSWIVRMDQPHSRVADTLLDRQYWAPDDEQKQPYDDTGWSFGDMFGVDVARVVDASVLQVKMRAAQKFDEPGLSLASLGVDARRQTPRIALMHTWHQTQGDGWWRHVLDDLHVPYTYISTQDASRDPELRSKYDVILFAPVGFASTRDIIDGLPMYGNPLPWQKSALTPNLGVIDSTPDMRPGLGESGVANLKRFVTEGGLLVTAQDSARFAVEVGLAPGVSVADRGQTRVVGSVLRAALVDKGSPVVAGYDDSFALYSANGMAFNVSDTAGASAFFRPMTADDYKRPTGRGGPQDHDVAQGRPYEQPPALPNVKPWQPVPLNEDDARNNVRLIPPAARPRVVVRWADANQLLIAGLLDNGSGMAARAAVVDAHYGNGHVLLFANNPIWRGETIGSYAMVFNAIMNFDRLDAGKGAAKRSTP